VRVAAIIGESGSGKTTLISGLIRHFRADGRTVAAIKHTHHPLNEERRGDTGAFEAAGAERVIFAADREAVIFTRQGTERIRFQSPQELVDHAAADIVLIEGFKRVDLWPRIELDSAVRLSVQDAVAILDRIWGSR
jgi:molybdopterin-guanine dinucleotide biosynthesis adapter protein